MTSWQQQTLFRYLIILLVITMSACGAKPSVTKDQATIDYDLLLTMPKENISYNQAVKPVLDKRCVVCHGCYDAPCQLKLSSHEGLQRGASKIKVYDGARIRAIEPTRLGIDAKSTDEWRDKGFHALLNEGETTDAVSNLQNSVLYQMLRLKQLHPQPRAGMLSDDVDVSLDRKQVCSTAETFADFATQHPLWGMPYAMPNLSNKEYATLVQWIAQGSPGPEATIPSPNAHPQIQRWEAFLNASDLKQQLVSRYLYEHLVQAHIHFSNTPAREFYRLVRSFTPPGEIIDEIPTVRPYDNPGPRFYYRLLRYQPSIVVKDHNVYEWSDQRMQRYRELFIEPQYEVKKLPGYKPDIASNPFKVYAAIPPVSRYQFLLDEARFFIEGFIKGPVCRGQIALNVIEDQFWVFFSHPNPKAVTLQPEFLDASMDYLNLPAEQGDDKLRVLTTWRDYLKRQRKYLATKNIFLRSQFTDKNSILDIEEAKGYIWQGEKKNPNAALTVFRHFDSASVSYGLVGDYPETAWVIDYPLLERIHYLLVAGFNVYGNVTHQLTTRIYMDFLRMEAENHFLLFMPVSKRKQIRDDWYVGMQKKVKKEFEESQQVMMDVDTVTGYKTDNPQREFYQILQQYLGAAAGPADILNRCEGSGCSNNAKASEAQVDEVMRRIARIRGTNLTIFPDVAFVRIKNSASDQSDLAYTLILNKGYTNISSMFENEDRRDRSQDTLTVIKGLTGSYPNFFFVIDIKNVNAFVTDIEAIRDRDDYERFVGLYGVRRTDTKFWSISDWFHDRLASNEPLRAGIFDLNRYRNR